MFHLPREKDHVVDRLTYYGLLCAVLLCPAIRRNGQQARVQGSMSGPSRGGGREGGSEESSEDSEDGGC